MKTSKNNALSAEEEEDPEGEDAMMQRNAQMSNLQLLLGLWLQDHLPLAKLKVAETIFGALVVRDVSNEPDFWHISVEAVGSGKVLLEHFGVRVDSTLGHLKDALFAAYPRGQRALQRFKRNHVGPDLPDESDLLLREAGVSEGDVLAVRFERHALVVGEFLEQCDDSVIYVSVAQCEKTGLFRGDVVCVESMAGHQTFRIVLIDAARNSQDDVAVLSRAASCALRVSPGDLVTVQPSNPEYGSKVHILPFDDCLDPIPDEGDLFRLYLRAYFLESYRPVHEGDRFTVSGLEFMVVATEPSPGCIVTSETVIFCAGGPLRRRPDQAKLV